MRPALTFGNAAHYVAVPPDRDTEPVRRFACFTQDVRAIADWLKQCGIVMVAMQSTGVYWLPVYEVLVERGLEVFLVNARHTKNLPGRKSDVQESQWLMTRILDCVRDLWKTWSTYPRKVQAYVDISAFDCQFRHGGEKDY